MRIYISGSISQGGTLSDEQIKENVAIFNHAERNLKILGHEVVNPCKLENNHDKTWEGYMLVGIKELFGCDAIFMITGWEESRGARIEKAIMEADRKMVIIQQE